MFTYSNASKIKLLTTHDDLQVLANELIKRYDTTIVCGHRGKAEQNKAYLIGNSQKKWPFSKHNTMPSLAIDLAPYEKNGIDWSINQMAYFSGYVKSLADQLYLAGKMNHPVRGGIDWNGNNDIDDQSFTDAGHFELVGTKDDAKII